jgi:hypothetical protein
MFDRFKTALSLFLPDPRDKSDTPLFPHLRDPGLYRFQRDTGDDLVRIEEPCGDTYELVWFEFERYLKRVLQLHEMDGITITDRLWNFFAVEIEIIPGQVNVPIRTFDPGMEKLKGES